MYLSLKKINEKQGDDMRGLIQSFGGPRGFTNTSR